MPGATGRLSLVHACIRELCLQNGKSMRACVYVDVFPEMEWWQQKACGSTCEVDHSKHGNCLVCGHPWGGKHAGHTCLASRKRGSWPVRRPRFSLSLSLSACLSHLSSLSLLSLALALALALSLPVSFCLACLASIYLLSITFSLLSLSPLSLFLSLSLSLVSLSLSLSRAGSFCRLLARLLVLRIISSSSTTTTTTDANTDNNRRTAVGPAAR
jgi:hypothetical protein